MVSMTVGEEQLQSWNVVTSSISVSFSWQEAQNSNAHLQLPINASSCWQRAYKCFCTDFELLVACCGGCFFRLHWICLQFQRDHAMPQLSAGGRWRVALCKWLLQILWRRGHSSQFCVCTRCRPELSAWGMVAFTICSIIFFTVRENFIKILSLLWWCFEIMNPSNITNPFVCECVFFPFPYLNSGCWFLQQATIHVPMYPQQQFNYLHHHCHPQLSLSFE